jgi:tetratricopeptide (TPR) repeat protein
MHRHLAVQTWAAVLLVASGAVITRATGQEDPAGRAIAFTRDIAPLLFDRCVTCHHPDGDAPFSLLTYEEARSRASVIAAVTRSRFMPPWKSEPGYGEFIGHRHLTDQEIDCIQQWVAAGAPKGDPRDLPPAPSWRANWQLGTPDLVVTFPEPFAVRAEGPDFSRTFVVSLPVEVTRYARGLEFRPGNARVVHHANIRIDRTPASRQLDEADPAPGYFGLLLPSAAFPDGHFLGWTPGQHAPLLPKELAWRVTPATDLVVEIHFVPSGKPEVVQPRVGLYFSSDPPTRTPAMLRLGRQDLEIPAGKKDYVSTDSFVLPVDVDVLALQPHAHYRARVVRGTATRPDGTTTPLIYIKDWDYRWQHVYRYVKPVPLPKGTTLSMKYVFDNSADNPRNPHQPPQLVRWGQQSTDEMGDLWIQMLTRSEEDLQTLNRVLRVKHMTEEAVGYETMIRGDPSSVSLHNDVALLYAELGETEKAVAHFETALRLDPDSPPAHFNLGTALSSMGKVAEAIQHYQHALRLRPEYGAAHNNLAQAWLAEGNLERAEHHFREAARVDPDAAGPYYNLGIIARARRNMSEARDRFRHAVGLQPDWVEAVTSLAWTLASARSPSRDEVDEALRLAEHATSLTARRSAGVLDVLAVAQAAAGRFDAAVTTCEEALRLEPDARLAAAIRQRLTLYKQGQRYVWGGRR